MSKYKLAAKLADELGVSLSKANRFIDDVGMTKASRFSDEVAGGPGEGAASGAKRLVDDWWRPAAATGGLVGGGALLWRQQEVEKVQSMSKESANWSGLASRLAQDDTLSPEQKSRLVGLALNAYGANREKGNDQDDKGGGGLLGGDTQTLVVLLIVLALVFNYAMQGDE
jgi:hypothetical protein